MAIPHILAHVVEQPWALRPVTLALMRAILVRRHLGQRLTPDEIASAIEPRTVRAAERFYDPGTDEFYWPRYDSEGDFLGYRSETTGLQMRPKATVVSILGVLGIISKRAAQVDDVSGPGGTSIERLTQRFRSALADQSVMAIVLDVDSPGGGVYGVEELADEIHAARGQKPILAVANSLATSAAYWLATSADEVVVTPSGELGSVGVYAAHEDLSKFLEQEGVKMTLVHAGRLKVEGNPFEPLSDEARQAIQERVDDYYGAFVRAVARGRGVAPAVVRKGFGEGRVVGAKDAVAQGMADREDTLDNTVRRAAGRRPPAAQGSSDLTERQAALARLRVL